MSRETLFAPAVLAGALSLAACGQDAKVEAGIASETRLTSVAEGHVCAEGVSVGEEGQSFCTAQGKRIDLINGLLVPFPVRLVECTSVATFLQFLGESLIPTASAHGGHIETPEGAIDVAEPAGTEWDLGELAAAPGRYCGIELALEHLPPDTFPETVAEPHDEIFLYTKPCFFPNPPPAPPEHDHHCYVVPVHGEAPTLELSFPEPVTIDAERRELPVRLHVAYDTWFDGIDFAIVETDAEEQAKLVQNVIESITLQAAGDP